MGELKNKVVKNAVENYLTIGIKGNSLNSNQFAKACIGVMQTDFDIAKNAESETDEAHTGTDSLEVGKTLTRLETAPTFTTKLRAGIGLEELLYSCFDGYSVSEIPVTADAVNHKGFHKIRTAGDTGDVYIDGKYYNHKFYPMINQLGKINDDTADIPLLTLYNAHSGIYNSNQIMNNCAVNTVSFESPEDGAPTLNFTMAGDWVTDNIINTPRIFTNNRVERRTAGNNSCLLYIGAVGNTNIEDMVAFECARNKNFELNKNMEDVPCKSEEEQLGMSQKTLGNPELTGSFEIPFTEQTRFLEALFDTGSPCGHTAMSELFQCSVVYKVSWSKIQYLSVTDKGLCLFENDDVPYTVLFKFPKVTLTTLTKNVSGSDPEYMSNEWEAGSDSGTGLWNVELDSDVVNVRNSVDDTGIVLDDIIDTDFDAEQCNNPTANKLISGVDCIDLLG